jgi:hypothetical protein
VLNLTPAQQERFDQAYPLVALVARRRQFGKLPPGMDADDLESAGGEALLECVVAFDPERDECLTKYARTWLTNVFRRLVSERWKKSRRERTADADPETGALPDYADPARGDEADRASARQDPLITLAQKPLRPVDTLPTPAAVADRVRELRSAMYGSIRPDDVAAMMQNVIAAGRNGDLKAAKMVFDLVKPQVRQMIVESAPAVHQVTEERPRLVLCDDQKAV